MVELHSQLNFTIARRMVTPQLQRDSLMLSNNVDDFHLHNETERLLEVVRFIPSELE